MSLHALVDGNETAVDPSAAAELRQVEPGVYHLLDGDRSIEVRVVRGTGQYLVEVEGRSFSVELFDPRDRRDRSGGAGGHGRRSVAAPMPGRVVRVLVCVGDAVEAGQGLLVVEAMKMQNEMKSPKAGRVISVGAGVGDTVGAGDVLVVVE